MITIFAKDYQIFPGATNIPSKLTNMFNKLVKKEGYTILFESGVYDILEEECQKEIYFMTNTCSEKEMYPPVRKIGFWLKNLQNICLDGQGSIINYRGRTTQFVIDNCANITIQNFVIDNIEPTVAEFLVVKKTLFYIDVKINKDSAYDIIKGSLVFRAQHDAHIVIQEYNKASEITKRLPSFSFFSKKNLFPRAKQLDSDTVRIYSTNTAFKKGNTYQICWILRDGAGTFLTNSKNIKLNRNTYHFMHGMGVLGQMSTNIDITDCNFVPNKDRGRTTAAFADFVHFSMCDGQINIINTIFDGSRDDIINVHGNHFLVSSAKGKDVTCKFCHPQTYGFLGFKPGDKIVFVDSKTLVSLGENEIVTASLIDERTTKLLLKESVTSDMSNNVVIENITRTPNLNVDRIVAKNIPTRGILVTTRGKVVIQNSTFLKMYMSAILVSDDARNWYESGMVKDITIKNNNFVESVDWVLDIRPEAHNKDKKEIVHRNIRFLDNTIVPSHSNIAYARRTDGLIIRNNTISGNIVPVFDIQDCQNVTIDKN